MAPKRIVQTEIDINLDDFQRLIDRGWPEAKLDKMLAAGWSAEGLLNLDSWSKRYILEGKVWGDEPSRTAREVAHEVGPTSRILEIGFGYGRDLKFMLEQEHSLMGVEEATEGLSMAKNELLQYYENGKLQFCTSDIKHAPLEQKFFDAVYAHRMLHLIKPKSVPAFVNRVAGLLKPGGLLVLTARNHKDYNAEQMNKLDDNTAVYKNRDSHYVNFWGEARFRKAFKDKFNRFAFDNFTEKESVQNDVSTHLTMMVSRKMTDHERRDHHKQLQM